MQTPGEKGVEGQDDKADVKDPKKKGVGDRKGVAARKVRHHARFLGNKQFLENKVVCVGIQWLFTLSESKVVFG